MSLNSSPNPEINFRKNTGTETKVHIISETPINHGNFGDIFDAVIEINGHKKRFIVKKYSTNMEARRAFRNYSMAKEVGLKVFPTFRISEDEKSILMTTGFSDSQICIGSNNAKNVTDFEWPLIEKIENLGEFLAAIFAEGLKATQKRISLHADVFFFILTRNKSTKIEFVLGDLDGLEKKESIEDIGSYNIEFIEVALIEFCKKNINPSFVKNFLEKVESYYRHNINLAKNSNLLKYIKLD